MPPQRSPTPSTADESRDGVQITVDITVVLSTGEQATCPVRLWRYSPVGPSPTTVPRLLMVHGFRGDHHGLQLIVDALDDHEVLVPDLPGFGSTPPLSAGEHDAHSYAQVIDALAGALNLGDGDVVLGHSFGSVIVATHVADQNRLDPGRTWAGVVLLNPISDHIFSGRLLPGALLVEAYYWLCRRLPPTPALALLRSQLVVGLMNLSMIVTRDPEIIDHVRREHRRHFGGFSDRTAVLQAYRSSSRATVTAIAHRLRIPTLLVIGARDQLSTLRGRTRLASRLPGARVDVIRDVGHLLHYEKPAATARAVRRFLTETRGRRSGRGAP